MKKITKATFKAFIKKNKDNLFINVKSAFNGMVDMVDTVNSGFKKATLTDKHCENTLGIDDVWVIDGRNWFQVYEDKEFQGIDWYNCCGSGIIAIRKTAV